MDKKILVLLLNNFYSTALICWAKWNFAGSNIYALTATDVIKWSVCEIGQLASSDSTISIKEKGFFRKIKREKFDFIVLYDDLLSIIFGFLIKDFRTKAIIFNSENKAFEQNNIFRAISLGFNYIKLRRFINFLAQVLSRKIKSSFSLGLPNTIVLEISATCNLKCRICITGQGKLDRKGFLSWTQFKEIVDKNKKFIIIANSLSLGFYGEVLLNKNWISMTRYLKKIGVSWIDLSTNGNFKIDEDYAASIIDSGLNQIVISLDGINEEQYLFYRRGGSFYEVVDFAKKLVAAKKRAGKYFPEIILQLIVTSYTEDSINEFKKLASDIGVDNIRLKPFVWLGRLQSTKDEFYRYLPVKSLNLSYYDSKKEIVKKIKSCEAVYGTIIVGFDGRVGICCMDPNLEGLQEFTTENNIYNQPLLKIWNSLPYRLLRRRMALGKDNISICKECPAD